MTLTIGRVTGLRLGSIVRNGDSRVLNGIITATSNAELRARYQQLEGLVGNIDEASFSITDTTAADLDGYYRINSVTLAPIGVVTGTYARFVVDVTRVAGGFATPQFETFASTLVRTNVHGVTAPSGIVTSWYSGSGTTEADITATLTWPGEDGNTSIYYAVAPVASSSLFSYVQPADYYKGAARVEVKYGSTWYPLHGQQLPLAVGTNWRISNGIVRLYPTSVGGNGRFTIERYLDGWAGREFGMLYTSTLFANATTNASGIASPVSVIVNRPEIVVLRVKSNGGPGTTSTFDITLRRGDLWCEVTVNQKATHTARAWGIGCSTATAMTAFTGGARATANDANGLRAAVSCPVAVSTDLTNGYVYLSAAARSATFQVSPDYGWAGGLTDTQWRDGFLSSRLETQRVVAR